MKALLKCLFMCVIFVTTLGGCGKLFNDLPNATLALAAVKDTFHRGQLATYLGVDSMESINCHAKPEASGKEAVCRVLVKYHTISKYMPSEKFMSGMDVSFVKGDHGWEQMNVESGEGSVPQWVINKLVQNEQIKMFYEKYGTKQ